MPTPWNCDDDELFGAAMQSDAKPQGQVRELLVNKALELFTLCDKEDKGFINKRDMQKLQGELPLEPEQLEMVFDSLDVDHNGYLTLEEFTDGFGMFLGFDSKPRRLSCQGDTLAPGTELVPPAQETLAEEMADDDDRFEEFLDNLGAQNLFQDEDYVRDTWSRLQENQDSAMLAHFEQFLTKVMGNIRTSETQCYDLESALLTRRQKQEEQVERLYEEMEQQLRQEKDKLLAEERQKERKLREELEQELKQKDQLLQLLMEKHAQLEAQLRNVNTNEAETKQENAKLLKELNRLEVRLVDSERSMQEMQRQADTMRQHSLEEKRRRAKTAMKVTEGIAMERESLVKQLSLLRDVNKELTDQKDEINLLILRSSDQSGSGERLSDVLAAEQPSTAPREHADRRGSVLSNYIVEPRQPHWTWPAMDTDSAETEPELDEGSAETEPELDEGSVSEKDWDSLPASGCQASESGGPADDQRNESGLGASAMSGDSDSMVTEQHSDDASSAVDIPEGKIEHDQAPQLETQVEQGQASVEQPRQPVAPERVFKVVIVGDSGVGKSCLLNRVCKNAFAPTFKSTIGVDFQVKSMTVDGRQVAMQLWDTAGQERFRSITKQYYRRADGVILVYDVSSETSFKNIRGWMCNLQEGVGGEVVLLLLGNKVDLTEVGEERQVSHLQGNKLAHEIGALFYETSAKTSMNVSEAIEHMASLLRIREDEEIDRVLWLKNDSKKQSCCK